MYSTCLFCTKDLGTNDVVETPPIGRRLAFDAAQGRLWVVCRHCAKWNLIPFDTRLESIDVCERLFRDTPTRLVERTLDSSTDLLGYVTGSPLRYESKGEFPLAHVPGEVRLALEMAAHEESERRALAGELKLLEREWRDAELLAKISDDMVLGES